MFGDKYEVWKGSIIAIMYCWARSWLFETTHTSCNMTSTPPTPCWPTRICVQFLLPHFTEEDKFNWHFPQLSWVFTTPIILSKHFLYLSPSRPANWASRLHMKSKGTTFNFQTQIHHPHWVKSELRYYKAEYKMIQHLTRVQEKVPHCWDGNH